jgi:hypothetical protein
MFRAVSQSADLLSTALPSELQIGLANPIPDPLPLGKGTALCLSGWYQHPKHPAEPVRSLCCVVNGTIFPVHTQAVPRDELPSELLTESAAPHCCGFWTILPLTEKAAPPGQPIEIKLRATLGTGRIVEQVIARTRVQSQREFAAQLRGTAHPPAEPSYSAGPGAKVAICMATYNPDPALFHRQIESIRAQTHANWRCIISDDGSSDTALQHMQEILGSDERFAFYHFAERLGFYHNFERALTLAPAEAEFIALADQDDYWFPHKLATLLAHFDEQTRLVYSDLRLVTPAGEVLADTYWTHRRNNYTRLGPLVLMNTVPGASAMLRRTLLAELLPFPPQTGKFFHDHWLGVVALAGGPLKYVDEPLYDYVRRTGAHPLAADVASLLQSGNHLERAAGCAVCLLPTRPAHCRVGARRGLTSWPGLDVAETAHSGTRRRARSFLAQHGLACSTRAARLAADRPDQRHRILPAFRNALAADDLFKVLVATAKELSVTSVCHWDRKRGWLCQ